MTSILQISLLDHNMNLGYAIFSPHKRTAAQRHLMGKCSLHSALRLIEDPDATEVTIQKPEEVTATTATRVYIDNVSELPVLSIEHNVASKEKTIDVFHDFLRKATAAKAALHPQLFGSPFTQAELEAINVKDNFTGVTQRRCFTVHYSNMDPSSIPDVL